MKSPEDLVIVSFLEDQPVGKTFRLSRNGGWPYHITLIPWFMVEDESRLHTNLVETASKHQLITLIIGDQQLFGDAQDIPVNVIENQQPLKKLHEQLMDIMTDNGASFLQQKWTRDNYQAHVTQHQNGDQKPLKGNRYLLKDFSLVRLINDDTCEVLKRFRFGGDGEAAA